MHNKNSDKPFLLAKITVYDTAVIYLKQNEAVNKGLANHEIEEKAPAKFGLKTNHPTNQ